ncbi:MAG: hypothetical protein ACJ74E_09550 [Actinomycetes bacterium]
MTLSEQQSAPDAVPAGPLADADVWFGRFFDDAALFPPRRAHATDAVVEHRAWRKSGYASFVGPLVCSDAQWRRVKEQLDDGDAFEVALTVPGGVTALAQAVAPLQRAHVSLTQIEVAINSVDEVAQVVDFVRDVSAPGRHTYVELPLALLTTEVCSEVAAAGLRLKVRTGGITADAFPSELELASAILACVKADAAFKLTAGLHHAVRHRDVNTGFEHHGFLNVLLATSAAVRGSDASCVATMLGLEHPTTIAASIRALDHALAEAVRQHFISFGTCSIDEPIEDLVRLGLIAEAP